MSYDSERYKAGYKLGRQHAPKEYFLYGFLAGVILMSIIGWIVYK